MTRLKDRELAKKYGWEVWTNPVTKEQVIDSGSYPRDHKCPFCNNEDISCSFNVGCDCECLNCHKEF